MCYDPGVARRQRVFQQERAQKTYESILRAAARVFPKKGFDKTQTPDIAKAAGISVGAVYKYFEDKREIFLEMLENHLNAVRAEVAERLAPELFVGGDPQGAIARVLDVLFDQIGKDPALAKVYLAMSLTDKDVERIRRESETYDREFLANVIGGWLPRERIPDPHAAAIVIERAVTGTAIDCALGATTISAEQAKAALQSMILRYLFGEPS